jgi:hypothetical protein
MLRCLIQQLRSVINVLSGLEVSISQARRDGNMDLLTTLECAKENAHIAANGMLNGIEPIKTILELAGAFMSIAQIPAIKLPAMAPADDLTALKGTLNTLQEVIDTMQSIIDALP